METLTPEAVLTALAALPRDESVRYVYLHKLPVALLRKVADLIGCDQDDYDRRGRMVLARTIVRDF